MSNLVLDLREAADWLAEEISGDTVAPQFLVADHPGPRSHQGPAGEGVGGVSKDFHFIPSPWGLGPLPRLKVWATKQWRPSGVGAWLAHEITYRRSQSLWKKGLMS